MNFDRKGKRSILSPMADAYEPSTEDGERVFKRLEAYLATATSVAPASRKERAWRTREVSVFGLSCLVAAFAFGSWVYSRDFSRASGRTDAMEKAALSSEARVVSATSTVGRMAVPPSVDESSRIVGTTIPGVSIDRLPEAVLQPHAQSKRIRPTSSTPPTTPARFARETSNLAEETRLLAAADNALRSGDALRALSLLDEHERRFPRGLLAGDRAGERVLVLCSLGQREQAIREGEAFMRGRSPTPLTRRVARSCAGEQGGQ